MGMDGITFGFCHRTVERKTRDCFKPTPSSATVMDKKFSDFFIVISNVPSEGLAQDHERMHFQ